MTDQAAAARPGEPAQHGPPPGDGAVGTSEAREDAAAADRAEPVRRVLVVDDDPTVAEVVTGYLVRAGYAADHAADGPSALARAAAHPPTWSSWTWALVGPLAAGHAPADLIPALVSFTLRALGGHDAADA